MASRLPAQLPCKCHLPCPLSRNPSKPASLPTTLGRTGRNPSALTGSLPLPPLDGPSHTLPRSTCCLPWVLAPALLQTPTVFWDQHLPQSMKFHLRMPSGRHSHFISSSCLSAGFRLEPSTGGGVWRLSFLTVPTLLRETLPVMSAHPRWRLAVTSGLSRRQPG